MNKLKIMLLQSYICIASVSAAIITPALPQIEKQFALSNGSVEWMMSIFLFGYVIGQLIYGPIANRFGRLKALRFGLTVNLVGIVICLAAANGSEYGLLLLGRLITALGAAAGLSCTVTLINELLSKDQAKYAMSMALVFFTAGIGLAVTLSGILTDYYQWQYCFLILLLHGVIMLISTWQFEEPLKNPQSLNMVSVIAGYYRVLQNNELIKYAFVVGLNAAVAYCYSTAAPVYAQTSLHLSASQYGYWNGINIIGMLGSGYLSAALLKRWDAKKIIAAALILMMPCLLSLALMLFIHSNPIWFFTTTMLLYLFGGLLFPSGSLLASNAACDKANASSMMSFIYMGSAMMSVIFMGYVSASVLTSLVIVLFAYTLIASFLLLIKKNYYFS